jgi:CubicO group peptidase (beta-lactamase class C family)
VPVTPETIFQSGSVGKQFTAAAVMLQVEDGTLALDDPISKYFTDAPPAWRPVTVRHLLTHTSGIPNYASTLDLQRNYTEDELTKFAYGMPLLFAAGSRWSYSNTGYVLLGILIHKISRQFYGDVLRDRLFKPLGMKTARIISEADIVPHRAAGYELVNGELKNQGWVSPSMNSTADGSLYLSMLDYIAWDRGLRSGAVLQPGSWAQIYTPVKLASGNTYPYGFGWQLDVWKGQPWYHHGGAWQGFQTYISRYLADDLTIVVLANSAAANTWRFVDGVARLVDPELPELAPSKPIADQEPALAERIRSVLAAASEATLTPQELPFEGINLAEDTQEFAKLLHPLGALQGLDLLDRRQLGDDRASTYAAIYADRTIRVHVALTPDDRISVIWMLPE